MLCLTFLFQCAMAASPGTGFTVQKVNYWNYMCKVAVDGFDPDLDLVAGVLQPGEHFFYLGTTV